MCPVCQAFWIPTCWYRQRESLALGILPNTKPQREGFALWWNIGCRLRYLLTLAFLPVSSIRIKLVSKLLELIMHLYRRVIVACKAQVEDSLLKFALFFLRRLHDLNCRLSLVPHTVPEPETGNQSHFQCITPRVDCSTVNFSHTFKLTAQIPFFSLEDKGSLPKVLLLKI